MYAYFLWMLNTISSGNSSGISFMVSKKTVSPPFTHIYRAYMYQKVGPLLHPDTFEKWT